MRSLSAAAPVRCSDPVAAQTAGIVYLPGDRHSEGLFLTLSVRENLAAIVLDRLSRLGFVSSRLEKKLVDGQMKALAVKAPSSEARIANLSGGNQQKVLFARSLAEEPVVFLADEPTRGVDAGARIELYRVHADIAASSAPAWWCFRPTRSNCRGSATVCWSFPAAASFGPSRTTK